MINKNYYKWNSKGRMILVQLKDALIQLICYISVKRKSLINRLNTAIQFYKRQNFADKVRVKDLDYIEANYESVLKNAESIEKQDTVNNKNEKSYSPNQAIYQQVSKY